MPLALAASLLAAQLVAKPQRSRYQISDPDERHESQPCNPYDDSFQNPIVENHAPLYPHTSSNESSLPRRTNLEPTKVMVNSQMTTPTNNDNKILNHPWTTHDIIE
jgi:hypothetical protein